MSMLHPIPKDLLHDDMGVSSIEYALLGSLVAIAILGALVMFSDAVKSMYELIAASIA